MVHGPRDRNTGGISVPDNASYAFCKSRYQAARQWPIAMVRVDACGEGRPDVLQQVKQFVVASVANDDKNWAETLVEKSAIKRSR